MLERMVTFGETIKLGNAESLELNNSGVTAIVKDATPASDTELKEAAITKLFCATLRDDRDDVSTNWLEALWDITKLGDTTNGLEVPLVTTVEDTTPMTTVLRGVTLEEVFNGILLNDWLVAFCGAAKLDDTVTDNINVLEIALV